MGFPGSHTWGNFRARSSAQVHGLPNQVQLILLLPLLPYSVISVVCHLILLNNNYITCGLLVLVLRYLFSSLYYWWLLLPVVLKVWPLEGQFNLTWKLLAVQSLMPHL